MMLPCSSQIGYLLVGAHSNAVGLVAEQLGLGGHLDDVGVAGNGPEILEAVGLAPVHR